MYDVMKMHVRFRTEGLKQQKMASDIDDRAPAGRESLWTTGKKVEFSKAHCEVQKQTKLENSF
jgi:hypothetical protein